MVTTPVERCCRSRSRVDRAHVDPRHRRAHGLPQPYLEQILLALKGAGLVRSKRGVGGGYVLARAPETITLGDIVSAVDGPIQVGDFGEPHQDGACDHEGQCVLLAIWLAVSDHMRRHLDAQTLADVRDMARGELPWPDWQRHA